MKKIRKEQFTSECFITSTHLRSSTSVEFKASPVTRFSFAGWTAIYLISENYDGTGKAAVIARPADEPENCYMFLGTYHGD